MIEMCILIICELKYAYVTMIMKNLIVLSLIYVYKCRNDG